MTGQTHCFVRCSAVTTAEGVIKIYGHPDELEEKAEKAEELVREHGFDRAEYMLLPY